jgi:hypothetical protein
MARIPRTGICVYCGVHGTVTKDHVPPKCLFPPETRVNLITVHACSNCHDSYKLDDEYFRVMLSIRSDLPIGPESQFLRDQTQKTLNNPEAIKFRQTFETFIAILNRNSSDGTTDTTALKIDAARKKRTANRIVRGLYAHFFGMPLPKSYDLTVNLFDLQRDSSALASPEVQELVDLLRKNGKHQSFGKVLNISCARADDDVHSSFWVIWLHGAFGFIGFTVPGDT